MRIGTVREIKDSENRVGLVPGGVDTLVAAGHEVLVESGAGSGSLISDEEFAAAGARIVETREEVFGTCDLLIKVKEVQPEEVELLREGQVLYTYLHLAPLPELTEGLLSRGVTAVAYETITAPDGTLPPPDPDERGCGPHGDSGRSPPSAPVLRRLGDSPRWGSGSAPRPDRHRRRWSRGAERGETRGRDRR